MAQQHQEIIMNDTMGAKRKRQTKGFLPFLVGFLSGLCITITIAVALSSKCSSEKFAESGSTSFEANLSKNWELDRQKRDRLSSKPPFQAQPDVIRLTNDKEFAPPRKSLHPTWKMWEEMNESEQQKTLKSLYPLLNKYGRMLTKDAKKGGKYTGLETKHGNCTKAIFGPLHNLCGPAPDPNNCVFFSFGINDDPTFDIEIADTWGCRGFAGDPTVTHPSKLHPRVTFHNFAAMLVEDNDERKRDKGGSSQWWYTSMPQLRRFLKVDYIDIIKLDCEGCEHSFARDIISEDPSFLQKVGQIAIETHVNRAWINTPRELYYFALQFALLEEAGFSLEQTSIFGCGVSEWKGCIPEFDETDFPCEYKVRTNKKDPSRTFPMGRSCHEFLWVSKGWLAGDRTAKNEESQLEAVNAVSEKTSR